MTSQVADGTLSTQGTNDILTMALCTPEHNGRVRAVGAGVTPSVFFHLTRRGSKKHINELESSLLMEQEKRKMEEDKRKEEEKKRKAVELRLKELEDKFKKAENLGTFSPLFEKNVPNNKRSDNREPLSHLSGELVDRETNCKRNQVSNHLIYISFLFFIHIKLIFFTCSLNPRKI